eukprot:TRINITY_DN6394_c0_g2_i1.p1 TRINITY_DN6394_c0_g2~~TRINITY_DN6394_c0_g2_i1.p1  ORF type:complete len:4557 (+),score=1106.77 TRINITY_DN6394_c0_g2_i1:1-13671(+)
MIAGGSGITPMLQIVHHILNNYNIQTAHTEMMEHETTPLIKIQSLTTLPKGSQLFETILVFENYPAEKDQNTTSSSSVKHVLEKLKEMNAYEKTNFPLTISWGAKDNGNMILSMTYDTSKYNKDIINRLMNQFCTIITSIIENGSDTEYRVDQISMMGPEDMDIDMRFNETHIPFRELCLHQFLEIQAATNPDAIAITFKDETISYSEFNRRSNQLARYLKEELHLGPGSHVGICMTRSIEMNVSIFAVLKIGGAYVTLDSEYPEDRIKYIMEKSNSTAVMVNNSTYKLVKSTGLYPISVESVDLDKYSPNNLDLYIPPSAVAYIIFTSGSTGKPKGIMLSHESAVCRMSGLAEIIDLQSSQRFLQRTTLCFDFSVWEVHLALWHGNCVVMLPSEHEKELLEIADLVELNQIDYMDLVPSMFASMIELDEVVSKLNTVKLCFIGGEAFPTRLIEHFYTGPFGGRLENGYGPTETTMIVCSYHPSRHENTTFSIGRAWPNTHLYIEDKFGNRLPIGVPGELIIGNVGIAYGYLSNPRQTAQSFIPDPYSGNFGARLFRSGDLCYRMNDGSLQYINRIDFQVKIRGFRIELGEIENVVLRVQGVSQVVVLVKEIQGSNQLVAYFTADRKSSNDDGPTPAKIKSILKATVPHYMVPTFIVYMEDGFPINQSGKIDRKSLPTPSPDEDSERSRAYVAPRNGREKDLAQIWAEVLKLERVGIEDNFFELGGDSISSIQVIAKANRKGINIRVKDIFDHPTISQLSVFSTPQKSKLKREVLDDNPNANYILSPIQRWYFELQLPNPHYFNQAQFLHLPGLVSHQDALRIVKEILVNHNALRTRFVNHNGEVTQRILSVTFPDEILETIPLEVTDDIHQHKEHIIEIANKMQSSLNIENGPLIRIANLIHQESYFLIVCHHLVVDGVSWRILFDDILNAYSQLNSPKIELSIPKLSFKQWTNTVSKYAASTDLANEVPFWLSTLSRVSSTVNIPTSKGQRIKFVDFEDLFCALTVEETKEINIICKLFRAQINDVLLTAFACALVEWNGGSQEVSFTLEGHGREDLFPDIDISRTVGWFTSMFPVVLSVKHDNRYSNILKSIKEQLRQIPNKGFGFSVLKYMSPFASKIRELEAQEKQTKKISFNYLGQFKQLEDDGEEITGHCVDSENTSENILNVIGITTNDILKVTWSYHKHSLSTEAVSDIASNFSRIIRALIVECQSPHAGGFTPSDFELVKISQKQIDDIGSQYIEDMYPLTPMQQGMFFHTVMEPHSEQYITQIHWSLDMTKGVDLELWKECWSMIFNRYAIFRTAFVWEGVDSPIQLVLKPNAIDFSSVYNEKIKLGKEQLSNFLHEDRKNGFEFSSKNIAMRFFMINVDPTRNDFIWTHHHLCLDGWSMGIVINEFFTLYNTKLGAPLQPSRPFKSFVKWLNSQDSSTAVQYWTNRLCDFSVPTPLPGRMPSSSIDVNPTENILTHVPQQLSQKLLSFARVHGVTMNTIFQAAWAFITHIYSREPEVLFGSTVSGRSVASIPNIESIVGLLMNTIPVLVKVDYSKSILQWIKEIQGEQSKASEYDYLHLLQVQSCSKVAKGTRLFDSLLVFENYPLEDAVASSIGSLTTNSEVHEKTNLPLTIIVETRGTETDVKFLFDPLLISKSAITSILNTLFITLDKMCTNPNKVLADLSVLDASQESLISDWNATDKSYNPRSIHSYFEQQVEANPDSIALVFEDESLTYSEFNNRANQLAYFLRAVGVTLDSVVGICMERGIEMMVSMMATLKCGAAYVPIDPKYPVDRQEYIIEDSKPCIVLVQNSQVNFKNVNYFNVCQGWEVIQQHYSSTSNLNISSSLSNLMYIIYTSGSTGRPKGVLLHHEGAYNRLEWMKEHIESESGKDMRFHRTLQKTSISFDVSVWELFLPLITGSTLVLLPPSLEKDPQALQHQISSRNITLMHFVPSMLTAFVNNTDPTLCDSLLCVVASGEALESKDCAPLVSAIPGCKALNYYGPTEASIDVSFHTYRPNIDINSVPIGKPIANIQLFVLDKNLNEVPIGVAGELYIGGIGLARGYFNRPSLTAERFIPNPVGSGSSRLYATGDLCRFASDGTIEYMGRIDFQVKIRGFRIELGEVEAAINGHPSVKQSVIVAADVSGSKRLVAYFTAKNTHQITVNELRDHLSKSLPAFMVPSYFIKLDTFPLLSNGKLDRKALPPVSSKSSGGSSQSDSYVPPRNKLEHTLVQLFQESLKVSVVGIEDNFFEIGGDSIISISVVSKAKSQNILMTVKMLFDYPTIKQLSQHVVVAKTSPKMKEEDQHPIVGPIGTYAIQSWFYEQNLDNEDHFNQSQSIEINKLTDNDKLKEILTQIVNHHDMLRLRSSRLNTGNVKQTIDNTITSILDLPYAVIDVKSSDDVQKHAYSIQSKIQLSKGPIVQFVRFNVSDEPQDLLYIAIHHLSVDGISWNILIEDLQTLLSGSKLPLKTTSYKVWTEKMIDHYAKQNQATVSETKFWKNTLASASNSAKVCEPSLNYGSFEELSTHMTTVLDTESTNLLSSIITRYRVQMNDILLCAFSLAILQATESHQQSVSFILEGHGREDILNAGSSNLVDNNNVDISRTVGWFTSMFPVCIKVGYSPSDLEKDKGVLPKILKSVKEQIRNIPNKGVGYGVLKHLIKSSELKEESCISGEKISSMISFNYLGRSSGNLMKNVGGNIGLKNKAYRCLDVNGAIIDTGLVFYWTYSKQLPLSMVETISKCFQNTLSSMISSHAEFQKQNIYTPSDFALVSQSLSQQQLDEIIKENVDVIDIYPLTPMQEGMMYHTLLDGSSQQYITQAKWVFSRSNVDVNRFKQSWQLLIDRHAIFRTQFHKGFKFPLQLVVNKIDINKVWYEVEINSTTESSDDDIEKYLTEDRIKGFDLSSPPLMRFHILTLKNKPDTVVFVWTHHHIYVDGWSLANVFSELLNLYLGKIEFDRMPSIPEYKMYVKWLKSQDVQTPKQFWSSQLKGLYSPTPLPVIPLSESKTTSATPSCVIHTFSKDFVETMLSFTRKHRITVYTLLQAAWGAVLGIHNSESDVVFGSVVSGRSISGIENVESMVGMFINTLPVRITLTPSLTISSWLRNIQQQQVEINQYEHVPLNKIQSWSDFQRGEELFHSAIIYENYPSPTITEKNEKVLSFLKEFNNMRAYEKTNLPLTITCKLDGSEGVLDLGFLFDKNTYSESTMKILQDQFSAALHFITQNDNQYVGNINLFTPETTQIEEKINSIERPFSELCIHELLEKQAELNPDSIAVVYEEEQLSYSELNRQSNRLARYLIHQGFGVGSIFGLFLPRSIDLLISMMAINKIGGMFIPLEVDYAFTRKKHIVETTKLKAVLTLEKLKNKFEVESDGMNMICLDNSPAHLFDDRNIPLSVPQYAPFCIFFTSGSTGKPKGIYDVHRGIVSRLYHMLETYSNPSTIRAFQRSSICFDACLPELFLPFFYGGATVLLPNEKDQDLDSMLDTILVHQVGMVTFVPSLLDALFTLDDVELKTDSVELFVIGGEAVPDRWREKFFTGKFAGRFENCYGPTEFSYITSRFNAIRDKSDVFSIGKPFPNTHTHFLDMFQNRLPPNVRGELAVGNVGLSYGYFNNPRLTAESFIPDSFSNKRGLRLYRTGDCCMRISDSGAIHYVNRLDFQVKVRGYRIELGEVDNALSSVPGVFQALAAVKENKGTKILVGYYVSSLGSNISSTFIKDYLKPILLHYMIPTHFVQMDKLPINSSGKLDRKALPDPESIPSKGELVFNDVSHIEPTTKMEQDLAEIWSDVLNIDSVSIHDNFYDLGGDSIQLIQVVSRASQKGIDLQVKDLIKFKTIQELAKLCRSRAKKQTLPAPQEPITATEFSLTGIQHWFFSLNVKDISHWNQSYSYLLKNNQVSPSDWNEIANKIVLHHDILRARFSRNKSGVWQQSLSSELDGSFFVYVDVSKCETKESALNQMGIECGKIQASLDILQGNVFKLVLVKLTENEYRVVLIVHHLVFDGVSSRILIEDISSAYHAVRSNQPISLPEKTNSIQQWSEAVSHYSQSVLIQSQTSFWSSMTNESFKVPLDYPENLHLNTLSSAQSEEISLDQSTTSKLFQLSNMYNVQLDRVILAAFITSYVEWTGNADQGVCVDLESHGREELFDNLNIMRTVGWFTSIYPVLLKRQNTLAKTIMSIRNTMKTIKNNGFDYLVLRYLSNSKLLSTPYQILFNYLGVFGTKNYENMSDFELTTDPVGALTGEGPRSHILDINAFVNESKLHISLGYSSKLHRQSTIAKLSNILKDVLSHAGESLETPIFLIHPVDGTVSDLEKIASSLNRSAYVLDYVQNDKQHYRSFETMAAHYISRIKAIRTEGPYIIGGFSFGGLLSYEIAQQLTRVDPTSVKGVVLFDQYPLLKDTINQRLTPYNIVEFFFQVAGMILERVKLEIQPEDLLISVQQSRFEGIRTFIDDKVKPKISNEEYMFIMDKLDTYETCGSFMNVYDMPTPSSNDNKLPLGDIPLYLLRSTENPHPLTDYGWQKFTSGKVQVIPVETNHYNVLKGSHGVLASTTLSQFLSSHKI